LAALVLVVPVTACARPDATVHHAPTPHAPASPGVFVGVDEYGAVFIDARRRRSLGILRDGTVAWQRRLDAREPGPIGCLARCPDAVFSGNAASANSPAMPDPTPEIVLAGQRQAFVAVPAAGKRRVLTARAADDFVLATGDASGWFLEAHHGSEVTRIGVGGYHTAWAQSADGRHALAVTVVGIGTGEARWFDRRERGWVLDPITQATPVSGVDSCVSPDGQHAILLGQRPAVLGRDGRQTPITDLESAGTCAWAGAGGIVASLSTRTGGELSQLRGFDGDGRQTWRRDVAGTVSVAANPVSGSAAYAALDALHEVDLSTGAELRTVRDVGSVRYDSTGALLVASPAGDVRWLGR
jgi:hypothetical protein